MISDVAGVTSCGATSVALHQTKWTMVTVVKRAMMAVEVAVSD